MQDTMVHPTAENTNTTNVNAKPRLKKITIAKAKVNVTKFPAFSEYADFVKNEYKVNELKELCKHYGIKCSGTKAELKKPAASVHRGLCAVPAREQRASEPGA